MKTLLACAALALAITSIPFAPQARAADQKGPRLPAVAAESQATDDRLLAPDTIVTGAIVPNDFSVIFIADLAMSDPARKSAEQQAGDPLRLEAARETINANPAVLNQLRQQNLDASNVVAIERDTDGSNVIFIR